MTTNEPQTAATVAATAAVIASASHATSVSSVDDIVAKIKSTDDNVRGTALEEVGFAALRL